MNEQEKKEILKEMAELAVSKKVESMLIVISTDNIKEEDIMSADIKMISLLHGYTGIIGRMIDMVLEIHPELLDVLMISRNLNTSTFFTNKTT